MVVRHIHLLAIVLCMLSLHSSAFAQLALSSNLHVTPIYLELVESMADQSATFRQQLLRVATAPGVTVHVDVVPRILGARAMTRMVRQGAGLTAWVEVARLDDVVDLIAHEIEHVIEQIDGVDLKAGAGEADMGIFSVKSDGMVFETARAGRVGISVAQEIRESARRGS